MRLVGACLAVALSMAAAAADAAPVLMISIDGLRPGDVLEAGPRGLKVPNLRRIAEHGAYATGVRNALPTVTYPNHTTLVTGVWPAVHGIAANTVFDPLNKNMEGWFWYAPDIQVPTLWDAVHAAGRKSASLGWPVTVDDRAIDYDLPEYWRARTPDDIKLEHALSTPGLPEAIEAAAHVRLADMASELPAADDAKAKAAAAIIALKHPAFFTLHLSSLDHTEHGYGPGSPEANAVLEQIDADVGALVEAARRVEPDLVVVIVSDHGFAPIANDINLNAAFAQAGLIQLNDAGRPTSWEAESWISGGSTAIMLSHPDDAALREKVRALLDGLAADPASGVGRVIGRAEIAAMGGQAGADFFVDAKIGYAFGSRLSGPLVTPSSQKGQHGYFPDHPEMRATLLIDGPGVDAKGSLGEVDMRDIAPTVARLLGVSLPSAQGKPLF